MEIQKFRLHLTPDRRPPVVYANQYDVGRVFQATILDVDGSAYTFTNETVVICGTKPDGTGFSYDATASGHAVTFSTTGQMTVVHGYVRCGIIITQGSTVIGTLAFLLYVQPAALQTGTIISSDDFGSIITEAVADWMDEHGIVIDNTLSVSGAAADAKAVGDELSELKSAIDLGSITPEIKTALLACFENVAWINEDGQDYVDALHDALYNRYWQVTNNLTNCTTSNESVQTIKGAAYTATITASTGYVMTGATVSITMGGNDITSTAYSNGVISIPAVTGALVITISAAVIVPSSITATFEQSYHDVFLNTPLDTLKQWLTVTASYSGGTTEEIEASNYELSGTLATGASTVTVTFAGVTDAFSVTVIGANEIAIDFSTITTFHTSAGETGTYNQTTGVLSVSNTVSVDYAGVYVPCNLTSGKKYRLSAVTTKAVDTSPNAWAALFNIGNWKNLIWTSGVDQEDGTRKIAVDNIPSTSGNWTDGSKAIEFYCTATTAAIGSVAFREIHFAEFV